MSVTSIYEFVATLEQVPLDNKFMLCCSIFLFSNLCGNELISPSNKYMLIVNRNSKKRYEIYSKLTMKTPGDVNDFVLILYC